MPIDDIIDKALDSAEEKIAESSPVEEVVAETSAEAPEVETVEPEKEQISGKEANEGEDEAVTTDAEVEKPAEVADEPIEIPAFLPAETKALLAEASPALRKKIVAAYEQQENTTRRALSESSALKAEKARVDEVVTPHKTRLAAQGVRDTADLVSRALAWDELMTKDIKGFLVAQMKQNGLTPNDLEDAGYDPSVQQFTDPRVDEALEEARAAKTALEEFQLNQERTIANQELETFKNGKDSTGVVRKPFIEMLEPQIAQTIALIKQDPQYAHLTRQEVLHYAYEYAVSNARAGFKAVAPVKAVPTNEQIIANAQKQKAASGSVRGAPASGTSTSRPRLKGDSFNERLDSALDLAESRASARR